LGKIACVGSGEGISVFASLCRLIPMEAAEKPFQTGPMFVVMVKMEGKRRIIKSNPSLGQVTGNKTNHYKI
jgi:hypothetical protein